MFVAVTFAVLLAATAATYGLRHFSRTRGEWLIDASGLVVQGIVVPLLQTIVLVFLLYAAFPTQRATILLPWPISFLIAFVALDYLYYLNHRLLHGLWWRWHAVHHTAARLDVIVTSRNTLWTPIFIVYVWGGALGIFMLRNPGGFIAGLSITAALDLWRHSPLRLPPRAHAIVSKVLITPNEHAWHHSATRIDVNFGANLSWWDRLHGTYLAGTAMPEQLGVALPMSDARKLFWPTIETLLPARGEKVPKADEGPNAIA